MATDTTPSTAPVSADGWAIVEDEAPTMISFDEIGDVFTGIFRGLREIVPEDESKERFDQATFKSLGTEGLDDGELCGINPGYVLTRALKSIPIGNLVRITFMKKVATGQPSDMNSFRVETKKP